MMNKLLFATAAALLAATPAFAQDEEPAPESGLTGFSVALIGGVDVLTIQENNAADSARGAMYGGTIGYDHQVGKVVIGVQGEITDSTASFDIEDLIVNGDEFSSQAGRDIYGGVRVGFPTGTHSMVYLGGGYVSSQITSVYASAWASKAAARTSSAASRCATRISATIPCSPSRRASPAPIHRSSPASASASDCHGPGAMLPAHFAALTPSHRARRRATQATSNRVLSGVC
jgi:opacity protein-like surface antigen